MSKPTPGPWSLCFHLQSHENDQACKCGYRGSVWGAGGELIVCEMGSSPDRDGTGAVQGHSMPMAERSAQLADARLIAAAPDMAAALDRIFSLVSYVNIHGVGEQPEPREDGLPQPMRVPPEEFSRIFQEIGTLASGALSKAEA